MLKQFLFIGFFIIGQNAFSQNIQIHYLGHSAFVMQFDNITVVTDYGKPNAWKEWGWNSPINDIGNLVPDIITYSHLHEDHYDSTRIPTGVKYILKNGENLEFEDLKISAIPTCEDKFGDFGNTSYLFSFNGINILHTGDIQTMIANIDNDTIAGYFKKFYPANIDLLIMPIEGKIKYIPQAETFIRMLNPKVVIPSHYWSEEYLDEFISYLNLMNNSSVIYSFQNNERSNYFIDEKNNNESINIIILKRLAYK